MDCCSSVSLELPLKHIDRRRPAIFSSTDHTPSATSSLVVGDLIGNVLPSDDSTNYATSAPVLLTPCLNSKISTLPLMNSLVSMFSTEPMLANVDGCWVCCYWRSG